MSTTCSLCGAGWEFGDSCRDRFDTAQALEFTRPVYFAVHHLSVPCYLLQHRGYAPERWLAARELLHDFVHGGLTPEQARRRQPARATRGSRAVRLGSAEELSVPDGIVWTFTIREVRLEEAELYCADVRRWTAAVLADTAGLVEEFA